ncbi:MAG: sodium:solute symporter family protein [bacterium]
MLPTPLAVIILGLHAVDFVCLVLYLAVITGLGLWAARKVHSVRDFFMPRRFGKAMMVMHSFGTGTHSDQAVSVARVSYTNGLSGIWYQWLWLFSTPFYWLIAPFMKRFRAITIGDIFEARYNRGVAVLYALIGIAQLTLNIGIMLLGAGKVIDASTGGLVNANVGILAMTVLFVVYGIAGGLSAAIVTDFLQGLMTILFSFLLLPFVLSAVGGLSGVRAGIEDPARATALFSLFARADIGVFYVVVISFNALVGIVVQPHTLGICAAGKTEMEGRVGFMMGTFVKRICTVAWCLTGVAAIAYLAGREVEPDQVYGLIARDFLPRILPGLLGIFLAALLASVMSSCDSFMTATSGLFTQNIYKLAVPGKADRHYLLVGRIASFGVVTGGVIFALTVPGVKQGLEIFWKMAAMIGIAFWLGLFWRRTTSAGAWAATLASLGTWAVTTHGAVLRFLGSLPLNDTLGIVRVSRVPVVPLAESGVWQFAWLGGTTYAMYLPWQMILYLAAGAAFGIIVSLLTRPVAEEKLERFYALTRTPIAPGESPDEPCVLPQGAETLPRRTLLPLKGIEIPRPSPVSMIGFVAAWVFVGLLIAGFVLIVQL